MADEVIRLNKETATQRIASYIKSNHISIAQIESDLGITADRLLYINREELPASEFLRLCQYLNVRPEQFKPEK